MAGKISNFAEQAEILPNREIFQPDHPSDDQLPPSGQEEVFPENENGSQKTQQGLRGTDIKKFNRLADHFRLYRENRRFYKRHFSVFFIFYVFHFWITAFSSFWYFPTVFMIGTAFGLKYISRIFLKRDALIGPEISYTLAWMIALYICVSPFFATLQENRDFSYLFFYTSHTLTNVLLMTAAVALGLRFSTGYEWRVLLWFAPIITIWVFLVVKFAHWFFPVFSNIMGI